MKKLLNIENAANLLSISPWTVRSYERFIAESKSGVALARETVTDGKHYLES
jgi:hypothetical protein